MVDKVIVACALLLAAGYAFMTEQVTTLPFGDPLGPKAFPRILTVAMLVCVALLVLEIASKAGKTATKPAPDTEPDPTPDTSPDNPAPSGHDPRWVVAATVAFTGLYFLLFEPVGFVITTTVYLLAMTMYFNPGK